jgi:hypothetical protein
VVPERHDLRPLALQGANINLSETLCADIVKIKIFKIENDLNKLLYDGFINSEKSINNLIKSPNHTKFLSVKTDLASGPRAWVITTNELKNLVIEDEIVVNEDQNEKKKECLQRNQTAQLLVRIRDYGTAVIMPNLL